MLGLAYKHTNTENLHRQDSWKMDLRRKGSQGENNIKVWYYGIDWKVLGLCQTVILERKVLIQGCCLLRECLGTVSEIQPTCQCLHILMAYCPFKPLAIICFDCTLRGTVRDAAAPLTVAPGFRAAESTHPRIQSHPFLQHGMGIQNKQMCCTPNRNSWQTPERKRRRKLSWRGGCTVLHLSVHYNHCKAGCTARNQTLIWPALPLHASLGQVDVSDHVTTPEKKKLHVFFCMPCL